MRNKFTANCFKCSKPVIAGTDETNMVGDRWATRHLNDIACQQALPASQTRQASYTFRDPFYNDWDDWYNGTSEDVNPNEGSK